jgi:hypothetical protein
MPCIHGSLRIKQILSIDVRLFKHSISYFHLLPLGSPPSIPYVAVIFSCIPHPKIIFYTFLFPSPSSARLERRLSWKNARTLFQRHCSPTLLQWPHISFRRSRWAISKPSCSCATDVLRPLYFQYRFRKWGWVISTQASEWTVRSCHLNTTIG